jgi:myo-inositol 2-dehydrogenase / D-chiro-inositol 1-dehydrogenase
MSDLRLGVVGAGLMGADHIHRITHRIAGAEVSAIIEPDRPRAEAAQEFAPGAQWFPDIENAIEASAMDAVLVATPGQFHKPVLLPSLAAGLPVLCEKPLTPDSESAWEVVQAEVATGKKLIQVGFMRRFDKEYMELRELIAQGNQGELLALRCQHRNSVVPESYHDDMLIFDSVVHEIDVVRFLTDSPIVAMEVRHLKRNSLNAPHLNEPILVLMETESGVVADVEMNVSVQFGYQVKTEAVFEKGVAEIGRTAGMTIWSEGRYGGVEHVSFKTRFGDAYDRQIQLWVNAAKNLEIAGPSAWDGYLAAAAVEAGLEALHKGTKIEVSYQPMPAFYR